MLKNDLFKSFGVLGDGVELVVGDAIVTSVADGFSTFVGDRDKTVVGEGVESNVGDGIEVVVWEGAEESCCDYWFLPSLFGSKTKSGNKVKWPLPAKQFW